MIAELMSSEESDSESENSIRLPWRSTLVDEFFTALIAQITSSRSSQSVCQSKRVEGPPSRHTWLDILAVYCWIIS